MESNYLKSALDSFGEVFKKVYSDFGKSIILIGCLSVVVFATQVILMPKESIMDIGFNWKILIVIIGFSLYWYVLSLLASVSILMVFNVLDKELKLVNSLFSFINEIVFTLNVLLLFLTSFVFYLVKLIVGYSEWFHFAFFVLANTFLFVLCLLCYRFVFRKLSKQKKCIPPLPINTNK